MWKWVFVVVCMFFLGTEGNCTDYEQVRKNAEALSRSGQKMAAAALLEGAVGADRGHAAEWLRGYILVLRNAPKTSIIAQFVNVANAFPNSEHVPDALLRVGYLRDAVGDDPGPVWASLARDHPKTKEAAEALQCLGHLALRNGDPDLAIKELQQSAAISAADPSCAEESSVEAGYAFISRYWKTRDVHSLTQAISALAQPTRTSATPKGAMRARLGRGEAFLILCLPERAVGEYQAALDMKPEDAYLRGIALFELGYCYCASQSWDTAVAGFDKFLADVPGATLAEKDHNWKQARPDFARTVVQDTAKANGLTGVDLVPEAAYWKAVGLLKLKRAKEAQDLAGSVATTFPGLKIADRLGKLRADCATAIREGK